MTAEQVVAATFKAHRARVTFALAGHKTCACGFCFKWDGDHGQHLSAAVVAALGLTEEQRRRSPSRVDDSGRNEWLPEYTERRFVTPWTES